MVCSSDRCVSRTVAIKPPAREQNNWTKVSPFLSSELCRTNFPSLDRFSVLRVEKPCASDVKVVQSIRKYERYHRPIAPPILFWPNRRRGKSHGNCKRTGEPRTDTCEDECTHEGPTDSPDAPVAGLLACHDRQSATQRHGPANGP